MQQVLDRARVTTASNLMDNRSGGVNGDSTLRHIRGKVLCCIACAMSTVRANAPCCIAPPSQRLSCPMAIRVVDGSCETRLTKESWGSDNSSTHYAKASTFRLAHIFARRSSPMSAAFRSNMRTRLLCMNATAASRGVISILRAVHASWSLNGSRRSVITNMDLPGFFTKTAQLNNGQRSPASCL